MSRLDPPSPISVPKICDTPSAKSVSPNIIEVPARIKYNTREERQAIIQLNIGMVISSSSTKLSIEITDENDPFFYYGMDCGETEFHLLKQEQSILVDFQQFPGKFSELVSFCNHEPHKFLCLLQCDTQSQESVLSVVETNYFKQLTHLSLKFRQGNDETLKVYLASKLRELKVEKDDLMINFHSCREMLEGKAAEVERLSEQISLLKHDNSKVTESLENDKTREVNALNETMRKREEQLKQAWDDEKRSLQSSHALALDELKGKCDQFNSSERRLQEANMALESKERELSARMRNLDHELEIASNELTHLRGTNKNLDTEKFSQDKMLTEVTLKTQSLERELKDKEDIIEKLNYMLKDNGENKNHLEDHVNLLKTQGSKLEEKLHASAQEINKGNQIIQKLQSDIKSQKNKVKFKNTVVQQQEQLIQQKDNQLMDMERTMQTLTMDKERRVESESDMERNNKELRAKLQESSKNLEANQAMIQYLNKQLNEKTVRYTSTYQPTFKPSERSRSPLLNTTNSTTQDYSTTYQTSFSPEQLPSITEPIVYREPEKF